MKVHRTNKLFYRKFPYKIELACKGAEYVKRFSHDEIGKLCSEKSPPSYFRFRDFTQKQKDALVTFSEKVSPLLNKGYQIRVEMNTVNFYLEDRSEYDSLLTHLSGLIKSVTEPASDEDLEKLFSKNHIVVCDQLPHRKYAYKVMLTGNFPIEQREKLASWMENYGESFRIPRKTRHWLHGVGYCYDPFMYVESSKQLMMLHIYLGDKIRKTYEFVLRDTAINTVSEDTVCQP